MHSVTLSGLIAETVPLLASRTIFAETAGTIVIETPLPGARCKAAGTAGAIAVLSLGGAIGIKTAGAVAPKVPVLPLTRPIAAETGRTGIVIFAVLPLSRAVGIVPAGTVAFFPVAGTLRTRRTIL